MSLIAWLLDDTGTFDKLRNGRYDQGSNCGWVQECEEVKGCITRICDPYNEAYGGGFYDGCINYCNHEHRFAQFVDEYLCGDDQKDLNAWELYGHKCPGFEPPVSSGELSIGNFRITWTQIGIFLLLMVLFYIIYKRYL